MNYLIPANAKSGKLIFGMFTKNDVILFGIGASVSILLLMISSPETFNAAMFCLSPLLICGFLVVPIPNYHNVLTLIKEIIDFFYGRRNYKKNRYAFFKND